MGTTGKHLQLLVHLVIESPIATGLSSGSPLTALLYTIDLQNLRFYLIRLSSEAPQEAGNSLLSFIV